MTKLAITADPNFVAPKITFGLIPTGDRLVEVIGIDTRMTKAGEGLNVTLRVLDEDEYRNRRVWVQLNLEHPDPKVQAWAVAELQALCKAVGVVGQIDTTALCGKPFIATIYSSRPKNGYEPRNSACKFRSRDWLYPKDYLASAKAPRDTSPPWADSDSPDAGE
jgi:hypothetical protein